MKCLECLITGSRSDRETESGKEKSENKLGSHGFIVLIKVVNGPRHSFVFKATIDHGSETAMTKSYRRVFCIHGHVETALKVNCPRGTRARLKVILDNAFS